jgi:hypothetical protein
MIESQIGGKAPVVLPFIETVRLQEHSAKPSVTVALHHLERVWQEHVIESWKVAGELMQGHRHPELLWQPQAGLENLLRKPGLCYPSMEVSSATSWWYRSPI